MKRTIKQLSTLVPGVPGVPALPRSPRGPWKKENGYDYSFMSKNIQVAEFDIMWSHLVLPETFPLTENKKLFQIVQSSFFLSCENWVCTLKSGLKPIARRWIKFTDGHLLIIYKSQLALRTRKLAVIMINVWKTQGLMKKMLHHEQQNQQNDENNKYWRRL